MSPPPIWGLFLLAAHNAGYGRRVFPSAGISAGARCRIEPAGGGGPDKCDGRECGPQKRVNSTYWPDLRNSSIPSASLLSSMTPV